MRFFGIKHLAILNVQAVDNKFVLDENRGYFIEELY